MYFSWSSKNCSVRGVDEGVEREGLNRNTEIGHNYSTRGTSIGPRLILEILRVFRKMDFPREIPPISTVVSDLSQIDSEEALCDCCDSTRTWPPVLRDPDQVESRVRETDSGGVSLTRNPTSLATSDADFFSRTNICSQCVLSHAGMELLARADPEKTAVVGSH